MGSDASFTCKLYLNPGQGRHFRASRNQDLVGLKGFGTSRTQLDVDLIRVRDLAGSLHVRDFVLLEQSLNASREAADDLRLVRHHLIKVKAEVIACESSVRQPNYRVAAIVHCIPCVSKLCWAAWYEWVEFSSAFDGMQPTLRQVPPRAPRFSTQATFSPCCAALMAAT